MTHVASRMICDFDELTADTLPNQILRATCYRLLQSSAQLSSSENRKGTRHCLELLADISVARIDSRTFRRVQLHRNNRHYRLLMHVCQLLHDLYLPEERVGQKRFRNILEQEMVMHRLFEAFVKQFAKRHCPKATVSAMKIRWQGDWDDEAAKVLPGMVTDVTLERATEKTILDCKFYKDALVTPADCLCGLAEEIHAERDCKLEEARARRRQQSQNESLALAS